MQIDDAIEAHSRFSGAGAASCGGGRGDWFGGSARRGRRDRRVDSRRAGPVQRMDHDRLGVLVGRRVFLPRQGERPALGGLVGLEPLVQPSWVTSRARASAI